MYKANFTIWYNLEKSNFYYLWFSRSRTVRWCARMGAVTFVLNATLWCARMGAVRFVLNATLWRLGVKYKNVRPIGWYSTVRFLVKTINLKVLQRVNNYLMCWGRIAPRYMYEEKQCLNNNSVNNMAWNYNFLEHLTKLGNKQIWFYVIWKIVLAMGKFYLHRWPFHLHWATG
jgi:hypothetical protein